ncbi:MAG: polyprenyl synthetase family protein [Desulfobacterales bacterium]|nr:polyprenyl synthetase family protein [Desulfobacterales bacterium]
MSDLKERLLARVSDDLRAIEEALAQNLNPHLDLVGEIAGHILFSGGKRLRPLLNVLSARLFGREGRRVYKFSTIFEYLHAATLLHDDLVDEGVLRRGKPAAHQVWDNPSAVLVGDFLLARSLSISAETEKPRVIAIMAGITENMSQGEIHQLARKGALDLTEEEYLEIIRRKTAVLLQGACQAGAVIAGAPGELEAALSDYGFNLGLAFQMADDLLDYTSNAETLGKAVGADLREGKLTLPVIHALSRADAADGARMKKIVQNTEFSSRDFRTLIQLLEKYKGIAYTRSCAEQRVADAKKALTVFDPSEPRDLLMDLADYALARKA